MNPDKIHALEEMMRVVVPGGQVLVLDMTIPRIPFLKGIYYIYLIILLPLVARILSSNPDAYYYLGDSILDFNAHHDLECMMKKAGLVNIEIHPLTMGIARLHIGYNPTTKALPA